MFEFALGTAYKAGPRVSKHEDRMAVAAATAHAPIDLGSAEPLNASVYSACGLVPRAFALAKMMDAPRAFADGDASIRRNNKRDFPRFAEAFDDLAGETEGGDECYEKLHRMSPAKRLALKQELFQDMQDIMAVAQTQIAAPKLFDGAPLPSEPALCVPAVDALLEEAQAQQTALNARITGLRRAQLKLGEMQLNQDAAALLQQGAFAFTAMPPTTADGAGSESGVAAHGLVQ